MNIIIDGYNLFKTFYRTSSGEDLDNFLKILENYKKTKKCKITVVFDGYNNYSLKENIKQFGGVRVIYTPKDINADKKIIELARACGKGIIVITSDNFIKKHVEIFGGITISSEDFLDKIFNKEGQDDDEDEYDLKNTKKGNPKKLKKKERIKNRVLKKI